MMLLRANSIDFADITVRPTRRRLASFLPQDKIRQLSIRLDILCMTAYVSHDQRLIGNGGGGLNCVRIVAQSASVAPGQGSVDVCLRFCRLYQDRSNMSCRVSSLDDLHICPHDFAHAFQQSNHLHHVKAQLRILY